MVQAYYDVKKSKIAVLMDADAPKNLGGFQQRLSEFFPRLEIETENLDGQLVCYFPLTILGLRDPLVTQELFGVPIQGSESVAAALGCAGARAYLKTDLITDAQGQRQKALSVVFCDYTGRDLVDQYRQVRESGEFFNETNARVMLQASADFVAVPILVVTFDGYMEFAQNLGINMVADDLLQALHGFSMGCQQLGNTVMQCYYDISDDSLVFTYTVGLKQEETIYLDESGVCELIDERVRNFIEESALETYFASGELDQIGMPGGLSMPPSLKLFKIDRETYNEMEGQHVPPGPRVYLPPYIGRRLESIAYDLNNKKNPGCFGWLFLGLGS